MGRKITVGVTLTVDAAGAAMTQTASGPDLSSIISAVAIGTMSTGIISMDAMKIVPNMAR